MISEPLTVFLVLAAVVYAAIRLEERFATFRALGAALVGILLAMALSNLGVLPDKSAAYAFLVGPGVSVGVVLILLRVDVRSVARAGPRMLGAFAIGALGTGIGAVLAGLALAGRVGPETWKLTGQFTGTYIGGGLNFAALGQALGTSSDLFSAAIAADVIVTAIWMATCLAVPALLGRARSPALEQEDAAAPEVGASGLEQPNTLERALHTSGRPVSIGETAALVAIALGALWGARWLAAAVPLLPEILWLTTLALAIAQIPAVRSLAGSALWGNYLLLLFLASNGASSVVANIVDVGPAVFYFAVLTVAIHGIVIFGLGHLLGFDLATLAVASQANVGGAASAIALAGARGYANQLLPGTAVGLLGYGVGNYCGFAVAHLMRGLLGT